MFYGTSWTASVRPAVATVALVGELHSYDSKTNGIETTNKQSG